MKRTYVVMLLVAVAAVLVMQCGGGGGGGTPATNTGGGGTPPPTSATVTGTVAGTTVIAYNQSNVEITRNTAIGNPKTFTLTLPPGASYKFYLVENEGTTNQRVYALYQGSTNVFTIGSAVTINLGYVDTLSGVGVPANNPLNVSGVSSGGQQTAVPTALAGSAFLASDISGTWNYVGLVSGYTPTHNPGWYYGSFTFDTSGTVVSASTITDSRGSAPYTPSLGASLVLMPSGVITLPSITAALYKGYMNHDKNFYVGTATMAPGDTNGVHGYNLQVAVKSGQTFTLNDYVGDWNVHILTSGASLTYTGWAHGTMTISVSGTASWSTITWDDGSTSTPPTMTPTVSADGIMTDAGTGMRGVTTPDKNTVFATIDDGTSYYFIVMQKKSTATFSLTDLQGTWTKQMLAAGDGNRWARGTANIDGSGTHTWTSIERAYAGAALPVSESLAISPDGIITSTTNTTIHGVMSQDKRMVITTSTEETVPTRYKITISQK
jgi:hypothetical protein